MWPSHIFPIILRWFAILHFCPNVRSDDHGGCSVFQVWHWLLIWKHATKKWQHEVNIIIELKLLTIICGTSVPALVPTIIFIFTWGCVFSSVVCLGVNLLLNVTESDYWPPWGFCLLVLLICLTKYIIKTVLEHTQKSYQVKDPLMDLVHPGESPNVLPILQARVEPHKVGGHSLIGHWIDRCWIHTNCKKLIERVNPSHRNQHKQQTAKTFALWDSESACHWDRVLDPGAELEGPSRCAYIISWWLTPWEQPLNPFSAQTHPQRSTNCTAVLSRISSHNWRHRGMGLC